MKNVVHKGAFLTELAFSSLPKPGSPNTRGELVRLWVLKSLAGTCCEGGRRGERCSPSWAGSCGVGRGDG